MEMKLTADNKKLLWILIIAVISLIFYSNIFGQSLRVLHEKSFDVNPGEILELEAESGDVMLSTWDNNEVYIKVFGNSKAEDYIDFYFEQTPDGVKVLAEKEGGSLFSWFTSIQMKFEIKVPSQFNADMKTSGGDISVDDLNGSLVVRTSGGDVDLKDTKGELEARTSGGDIDVTGHEGTSLLKTSGGHIVCTSTKGDLSARTSGGDIRLKSIDGLIEAHTSGGDVILDYTGENKGVDLTTSGGDIEVYLPSGFKADADLKSSGGYIDCDYSMSKSYRVRSNQLEADFNGGGERLYCRTSGGDVIVKEK